MESPAKVSPHAAAAASGLDEEHPAASEVPKMARFVISGEPFDIPWSFLLEKCAGTMFHSAANFALQSRKFDTNDRRDPRVVLVELSRDVRSFRVLRHFLETGELIVPPDEIDRALLVAEAGFFGLSQAMTVLVTRRRLMTHSVPRADEILPKAADFEAKAAEPSGLEREVGIGYVTPGLATIAEFKGDTDEAPDSVAQEKPWSFWAHGGNDGDTLADLTKEDAAIRAAEYSARLQFAQDQDATGLMRGQRCDLFYPYANSPGEDVDVLKPEVGPAYQFLAFPGAGYPIPEAVELVSSRPEFDDNLDALSLGILPSAIKGLPLVAAGGVVLAALHRWPGTTIPGPTVRSYAAQMSGKKGGRSLQALFVEECVKKGVPYDVHHRYRRHGRGIDEAAEEAAAMSKQLKAMKKRLWQMGVPDPDPVLPDVENRRLGRYASTVGIEWGAKGKLRFAGNRKFQDSDEVNEEEGDEEEGDEKGEEGDEGEDEDDEKSDAPAGASKAAVRTEMGAPHSPAAEHQYGDCNCGGPCTVFPAEASKTEAAVRTEMGAPLSPAAEHQYGDCNCAGPCTVFPAAAAAPAAFDPKAAAERKLAERKQKQHDRVLRSFRQTDIDLFLTTRSANEATHAIGELYRRLRIIVPKSRQIGILRTDQSISFIMPWPFRTVQVVTRLYYSAEQVALGFDIDCCCVVFDGSRVFALPRAIRALKTRTNVVDPSRQSTSYEHRLLKYAQRNFKIAIPGADVSPHIRAVTLKIDMALQQRAYVTLSGFQLLLGMLHAVAEKDRELSKMLRVRVSDYGMTDNRLDRRVRRAARYGHKLPFVFGYDLASVMFGQKSKVEKYGTHIVPGTIAPTICFQKKTPHVQARCDLLFTGSFHATALDWFAVDRDTPLAVTAAAL